MLYQFALAVGIILWESSLTRGIDEIRLVNGTYGPHIGRLEVQYNDTWSTICDDDGTWTNNNNRVACRELGFFDALCNPRTEQGFPSLQPQDSLVSNIMCRGNETRLDTCPLSEFEVTATCNETAGKLLCIDRSLVEVTHLEQTGATGTTVNLTWSVSSLPKGIDKLRWRIFGGSFNRSFYVNDLSATRFSYSIYNLEVNTSYSIRIRAEVRYPHCRLRYMFCVLSDRIEIRTMERDEIRLVNGTYGPHIGRLEVQYNDTWSTICDDDGTWTNNNNRVACRELGFSDALCSPRTEQGFPSLQPQDSQPTLVSNIRCRGNERLLDRCPFSEFEVTATCNETAGNLLCIDRSLVEVTHLEQTGATGTTVNLTWSVPSLPKGIDRLRWRIFGGSFNRLFYVNDLSATRFSYLIYNLEVNTSYSIQIRAEVRYPHCARYMFCVLSDRIEIRTMERFKMSNLSLRLVPPFPGVDYLGRVEVMYNNTWGTICDDAIARTQTPNVICRNLNFRGAICYRPGAVYGPGSGPIWMDNVMCNRQDEVLEDCAFNGWGEHNCLHSRDDLSVICQSDGFLDPISGFLVVGSNADSVFLSWNPFTFPLGINRQNYRIRYSKLPGMTANRILFLPANETTVRISRLAFNTNYTFTVQASYRFPCGALQLNTLSDSVTAFTEEKAPSGPPTSIHVLALNNTAIEVQWNLPIISLRNGLVRGFKIFVQNEDSEELIDVSDGSAREYIIGGLEPSTFYTISILAYTVADGVRSIDLTLPTYSEEYIQLIIEFGPDGNGQDYVTGELGQTSLDIHCGSGIDDAELAWYYSNSSSVSRTNRHLRQGNYPDGIAVLQLGNGHELGYCDAGVYTCIAVWNASMIITETRDFIFKIGNMPPTPNSPSVLEYGSTWVTLGLLEIDCDGGHPISELVIRYGEADGIEAAVASYRYVYGLAPSRRNYTVYDLDPDTVYSFSIQAVSIEFLPSDFSSPRITNTLTEAPSAPRDVTARLVNTPVVEIRWREPASINGIVTYYIVYAQAPMILLSLGGGQSVPSSLGEASLRVPGHIGAVNMTVVGSHSNVHFQVSAVVVVDGVENEGARSEVTEDSTVFVPSPNLPVPQNVTVVGVTNTSVTITWSYPALTFHVPILQFMIAYTSHVSWVSPSGYLVEYEESASQNVSASLTMATIPNLVPNTEYRFRVSALTEGGHGQEVIKSQFTEAATDDKLSYFQMKINPVINCYVWKINSSIVDIIRDSLIQTLTDTLCTSCDITPSTLQAPELRCNSISKDQASFRGRIIGTSRLSSGDILSSLEAWILSDTASIMVGNDGYSIDSKCPTFLDSPFAPDCSPFVSQQTTPPPTLQTTSPSSSPTLPTTSRQTASSPPFLKTTSPPVSFSEQPVISERLRNGISSAEMGGLVIGAIIIFLLVVFVVLLAVLLIRSFCCHTSTINMKKLKEEEIIVDGNLNGDELKELDNPLYKEA